jgi:type IV pilus assembly protein PilM
MTAFQRLSQTLRSLARGAAGGPIGLDIATEKLHMVQLTADDDPPVILAAISLPYAGGRDALLADRKKLKALIDRARSARPFRGNIVVSSLPQSDLKTMALTYQRAAGQSEAEAIITELRDRLKEEIDDSVVDYIGIHSHDGQSAEKNAVVAIARRDRVLAYLEVLESAGLRVDALDFGPAALTRLVASMGQDVSHANALLINFGKERSYLSLIWGRRLMLDREVEFGETRLVMRLAKTLDMAQALAADLLYRHGFHDVGAEAGTDEAEITRTTTEVLRPEFSALAGEVAQTLIYAASKTRGQSVERIYLMGSAARYPRIASLIEGLVSMPVEVLNPFTVFTARPDAYVLAELDPIAGIGMATGLALRGSPYDD